VYPAPSAIKSEVFARMPDRLRAGENVRLQSGVAGDCFLEGPSFDPSSIGTNTADGPDPRSVTDNRRPVLQLLGERTSLLANRSISS
jgi:hypothetical protein